jgi:N-acetylglucosaminyldiphosphoundecaprenol N-acetyl-beta-D-mannosaminyltransferase
MREAADSDPESPDPGGVIALPSGPVTVNLTLQSREPAPMASTVDLFGLSFHTGSAAAIIAAVAARRGNGPRMIVTANVDHIVQLSENGGFREAYGRAAARTLDGMPLVWLARMACRRPVQRITGHDLLACILAEPPAFAERIFFVSSRQDAADMLARRLRAMGLPDGAVTSAVPPFGFESDPDYGRALAGRIRAHGTTLLVMGVGAPKSEIWVDRLGSALGTPVVFCVGDAVAVAAGCLPRAPRVMQRLGLEWIFRFLQAPRRLFHRYFVRSWRFVGLAARDKLRPRP